MSRLYSMPPEDLARFVQRTKASSLLPEEPDMPRLLGQILQKAAELVPSESGAILLDDPLKKGSERAHNQLHFVAAFGPTAEKRIGVSIPADDGVAGHVYTTGSAHLAADTAEDETFSAHLDVSTGYDSRTIIAAPIRIGGAVCGAIELLNRKNGEPYDAYDLLILEVFASYTASSIQNALDARHAQELAKMDDLTGLYNDRYLHVRLQEELDRLEEDGDRCALIFMDLDHFKPINDTYGHLVGSQVLREVGFILRRATANDRAVVARYGGDEFTIVLPGRSADEAAVVAERVRRSINAATFLDRSRGPELPALRLRGLVSASLGVADTSGAEVREGEGPGTLIRRADQAMYAAKAAGKNLTSLADRRDPSVAHLPRRQGAET